MDRENCRENGLLRCATCCLATSGGSDTYSAAYQSASSLLRLRQILSHDPESTSIDAFHALSDHIKEIYEQFSYPGSNISVIPNAVDRRFEVPHQSDFQPPYRLLYVGSLKNHKGVLKLVPLIDRLRSRSGVDFELTIVGEGDLRSSLETEAERRGLLGVIDFRGHVEYEELPEVYAKHDLFVYPGEWDEPFGRVFLEALATGTPTIASDVGAAEEILGEGGFVMGGSVAELTDGIETICTSGQLHALSEAASAETDRFRREAVIDRFTNMYQRIGDR
jgi:glycosyltransferase involved in cell wall biosynthesis